MRVVYVNRKKEIKIKESFAEGMKGTKLPPLSKHRKEK